MTTDEDQLLIDAMNAQVKRQRSREARQAREQSNGPRWSPPRCAQCRQRPADITEYEWKCELAYVTARGEQPRPFFCSQACGRAYRDHKHGFRGRLRAPISTETGEAHV